MNPLLANVFGRCASSRSEMLCGLCWKAFSSIAYWIILDWQRVRGYRVLLDLGTRSVAHMNPPSVRTAARFSAFPYLIWPIDLGLCLVPCHDEAPHFPHHRHSVVSFV